jgi:DNA repair protein RecO (recombination protein O)
MDERTIGIILRTRPLTETSLIVQWLTRDFGRVSTVAKGARRPKSLFLGKLDLFYLAEFSFHQSRSSDLHTLREVCVREFHPALRKDLAYLQQACYFAQLLEHTTESGTPLPAFFELFRQVLDALSRNAPKPLTVFAFEMKLLTELGLAPEFHESGLTPGARQILQSVAQDDWELIARIRLSPAQENELGRFLHQFLLYHLGKLPRGRDGAVGGGGS